MPVNFLYANWNIPLLFLFFDWQQTEQRSRISWRTGRYGSMNDLIRDMREWCNRYQEPLVCQLKPKVCFWWLQRRCYISVFFQKLSVCLSKEKAFLFRPHRLQTLLQTRVCELMCWVAHYRGCVKAQDSARPWTQAAEVAACSRPALVRSALLCAPGSGASRPSPHWREHRCVCGTSCWATKLPTSKRIWSCWEIGTRRVVLCFIIEERWGQSQEVFLLLLLQWGGRTRT